MESSENRAGFLGMLLLELAVFVLWFRLCFGKVEFDKASSVFRCSVIWCCDSRPGSICVVWVCLLLSSILGRQQEALLVLYSSCSRVVWVWCFFFSSSSFYYFDGIHVYSAHLYMKLKSTRQPQYGGRWARVIYHTLWRAVRDRKCTLCVSGWCTESLSRGCNILLFNNVAATLFQPAKLG